MPSECTASSPPWHMNPIYILQSPFSLPLAVECKLSHSPVPTVHRAVHGPLVFICMILSFWIVFFSIRPLSYPPKLTHCIWPESFSPLRFSSDVTCPGCPSASSVGGCCTFLEPLWHPVSITAPSLLHYYSYCHVFLSSARLWTSESRDHIFYFFLSVVSGLTHRGDQYAVFLFLFFFFNLKHW